MSKILTRVQSSSDAQKFYQIVEGNDGVIYCDCWAWKTKKHCKHLDQFQASRSGSSVASTPKSEYEALWNEIE